MSPRRSKKKILEEYEKRFEQASMILSYISEDRTTPRNIRRAAKEALSSLNTDQSHAIRASQAVNILDDISQDPNMPPYTRTRIWNLVSLLEIVKG